MVCGIPGGRQCTAGSQIFIPARLRAEVFCHSASHSGFKGGFGWRKSASWSKCAGPFPCCSSHTPLKSAPALSDAAANAAAPLPAVASHASKARPAARSMGNLRRFTYPPPNPRHSTLKARAAGSHPHRRLESTDPNGFVQDQIVLVSDNVWQLETLPIFRFGRALIGCLLETGKNIGKAPAWCALASHPHFGSESRATSGIPK